MSSRSSGSAHRRRRKSESRCARAGVSASEAGRAPRLVGTHGTARSGRQCRYRRQHSYTCGHGRSGQQYCSSSLQDGSACGLGQGGQQHVCCYWCVVFFYWDHILSAAVGLCGLRLQHPSSRLLWIACRPQQLYPRGLARTHHRRPVIAVHLPCTCRALAPHLPRTCPALAPHLARTCPALAPHLPRTCRALGPHLARTWPALAAHLPRTCPHTHKSTLAAAAVFKTTRSMTSTN